MHYVDPSDHLQPGDLFCFPDYDGINRAFVLVLYKNTHHSSDWNVINQHGHLYTATEQSLTQHPFAEHVRPKHRES